MQFMAGGLSLEALRGGEGELWGLGGRFSRKKRGGGKKGGGIESQNGKILSGIRKEGR